MLRLPAPLQDRVNGDLTNLVKDLQKYVPEPGASMSFSFLTSQGLERYSYDWTENLSDDGSKPLSLLNHVGGDPLFAVLGRTKHQPENYQLLVKWLKVIHGYIGDMGIPTVVDPQSYKLIFQDFQPILERIDRATSEQFLPALADGQSGLVIDSKLTSKQWFQGMPPTNRPLPLPELGMLLGVSDAGKLKKAGVEYRESINQLLVLVSKLTRKDMPSLPAPEMASIN